MNFLRVIDSKHRKRTRQPKFISSMRLFAFHTTLIPLYVQTYESNHFSSSYKWIVGQAELFNLCMVINLSERKPEFKLVKLCLKKLILLMVVGLNKYERISLWLSQSGGEWIGCFLFFFNRYCKMLSVWRCKWCNNYHQMKWTWQVKLKFCTRLFAFSFIQYS